MTQVFSRRRQLISRSVYLQIRVYTLRTQNIITTLQNLCFAQNFFIDRRHEVYVASAR